MKKVLLTDHPWPELDVERAVLAVVPAELVEAPDSDARTLAALAHDVDAIITCWANVPKEVIDAAGRCRIIARTGIGLDNIDTTVATARKIVVTNVPDYCIEEVAEHTLALLLALGRKVAFYHHETKSGIYDLNRGPELRRLKGQTLGIVGLGKIGRNVATKAIALGLRVLGADPDQSVAVSGVDRCGLDELLARSDYVSLHVPLTESTRGFWSLGKSNSPLKKSKRVAGVLVHAPWFPSSSLGTDVGPLIVPKREVPKLELGNQGTGWANVYHPTAWNSDPITVTSVTTRARRFDRHHVVTYRHLYGNMNVPGAYFSPADVSYRWRCVGHRQPRRCPPPHVTGDHGRPALPGNR